MSVTVQAGATLSFDQFWRWLKHHANCILRAGTTETWLYDQEAFHWHLDEDPDRNPVVQVFWGKNLIGELVLESRDVLYVQVTPETSAEEPGQFLFEVAGAAKGEEPTALYHFLLAHGPDEEQKHGALKH